MVSNEARLQIIDSIARGLPLTKALQMSGAYSESSIAHQAVGLVSRKPFRDTMRQYVEVLVEKIGEKAIADELEVIRVGKAPFREARTALQTVWRAYNEKVGGLSQTGEIEAITGSESASIRRLVREKFWSPEAQAKIEEMREKAKAIQPGDLAAMATVLHAQDLLYPPKDARARNTTIRTAYEKDGLIGATKEVNLYQQNINVQTMPLAARQMMAMKIAELSIEKNPAITPHEVVKQVKEATGIDLGQPIGQIVDALPPSPIEGDERP